MTYCNVIKIRHVALATILKHGWPSEYKKVSFWFNYCFCFTFQTKIALQLYQVDHKSYLLDFKSLPTPENNSEHTEGITSGKSSRKSSANSSFSSLKDSDSLTNHVGSHHTMEFMEMCASLIVALAC